MANQQLYSTDCSYEITIINYGGREYSVTDQDNSAILGLSIHENLFDSSVITGDIKILDSAGLDERLPIIGQERIRIKFFNKLMPKTNYSFSGIIIRKSATVQDGQKKFYTLDFCSDEFVANLRNRVSKSYKGVLASDIIEDVYDRYLAGDPFVHRKKELKFDVKGNSDGTFFPMHFVFPTIRPFQAIDMVVKKSVASNVQMEGNVKKANFGRFLFYENKYGFYFKALSDILKPLVTQTPAELEESPMQSRAEQGTDYGQQGEQLNEKAVRIEDAAIATSVEVPVASYTVRPADTYDSTQDSNEISIISYKQDSAFNVINNLLDGMYSGRLLTYDTITKRIGTIQRDPIKSVNNNDGQEKYTNKLQTSTQKQTYYEYDYFQQFDNFRHVDKFPLTNNYHYGRGSSSTFYKYQSTNLGHNEKKIINVLQNTMKGDFSVDKQVERWMIQRYAQNRMMKNVIMTATIPGDHNRTIGEIVEIKLPSNYYPREEHAFYTGLYLITKITHSVAMNGTFTTIMELVKDSLHMELVSGSDSGQLGTDLEIENFVSDDPDEDYVEDGR